MTNPASRSARTPARPVLLLAARRSGTTFLLSCLRSHPEIQAEKRVFDVVPRLRLFVRPSPRSRYVRWRRGSPGRWLRARWRPEAAVADFVDTLLADARKPVLVIRLSYEQARLHPEVLRWAVAAEAPVIHLVRENALKTLVSRATSQARRVHHVTEKVAAAPISIPPRALRRRLRRLTDEIAWARREIAAGRHHELSYEGLREDRAGETRRLLEFLGVAPDVSLTSDLVKINPDSLAELLSNHAEVEAALRGTPWERFLA